MQLQVLQVLPNGALNCQLTLTRADNSSSTAARGSYQSTITGAWGMAAAPGAGAGPGAAAGGGVAPAAAVAAERKIYSSFTPCKLLCGCSSTDQLLLMRSMVLETFESPMQVTSVHQYFVLGCNHTKCHSLKATVHVCDGALRLIIPACSAQHQTTFSFDVAEITCFFSVACACYVSSSVSYTSEWMHHKILASQST
jgi:hypothetical protein